MKKLYLKVMPLLFREEILIKKVKKPIETQQTMCIKNIKKRGFNENNIKYLRYDNEKNPIKNPNSEPDDQERPETIGSICEIRSNSKEHYLNIYIDHAHNLNQPMENSSVSIDSNSIYLYYLFLI